MLVDGQLVVYVVRGAALALEAGGRDSNAVKPSALLAKEAEEVNNWARLAFQLYFGWFALQFTINALAMSWLFSERGLNPNYARPVLLMFVGWNLMGLIGTVLVHRGLRASDGRVREVIDRLTAQGSLESSRPAPQSPMPMGTLNVLFPICAVTVFMALALWAYLLLSR
jgi:hypothetical protein